MPPATSRYRAAKQVSRGAQMWVIASLAVVLIPRPAYAYIDPVSGSVVFQVLAAGLLAAVFTVKRSWLAISTFLRRIRDRVLGRG